MYDSINSNENLWYIFQPKPPKLCMRTHNTDLISSYIEALYYSGAVNPFNYKITSEVMMKLY